MALSYTRCLPPPFSGNPPATQGRVLAATATASMQRAADLAQETSPASYLKPDPRVVERNSPDLRVFDRGASLCNRDDDRRRDDAQHRDHHDHHGHHQYYHSSIHRSSYSNGNRGETHVLPSSSLTEEVDAGSDAGDSVISAVVEAAAADDDSDSDSEQQQSLFSSASVLSHYLQNPLSSFIYSRGDNNYNINDNDNDDNNSDTNGEDESTHPLLITAQIADIRARIDALNPRTRARTLDLESHISRSDFQFERMRLEGTRPRVDKYQVVRLHPDQASTTCVSAFDLPVSNSRSSITMIARPWERQGEYLVRSAVHTVSIWCPAEE
ncbi:hypothetical protein BJX64DRAFT_284907 [Aspergillus heterothallicus]